MAKYARGKRAWGISDRSGFRYLLKDLVYEQRNGKRTGMRVGKDERDGEHPQEFPARRNVSDPQSLFDPRPDTQTDSLWGWQPVGNEATSLRIEVGRVYV